MPRPSDLSSTETAVLNALEANGRCTVKQLADHTGFSESSARRAAYSLWRGGTITQVSGWPLVFEAKVGG